MRQRNGFWLNLKVSDNSGYGYSAAQWSLGILLNLEFGLDLFPYKNHKNCKANKLELSSAKVSRKFGAG